MVARTRRNVTLYLYVFCLSCSNCVLVEIRVSYSRVAKGTPTLHPRDIMLCLWVTSSRRSEESWCVHLQDQTVVEGFPWTA
jgi:hypothetical protein